MSNTEIRTLSDNELDLASGGVWAGPDGTGGCIPTKGIKIGDVPQPGQYQDPFARYHIGRILPY